MEKKPSFILDWFTNEYYMTFQTISKWQNIWNKHDPIQNYLAIFVFNYKSE